MRRTELLFSLLLAGCMRIYPDPELPDVKVAWFAEERCEGNHVEITLTSFDSDAVVARAAPCVDQEATLADLVRERFHVEGVLRDAAGAELATSDGGEVDLRNGFNQSAGLFFPPFP